MANFIQEAIQELEHVVWPTSNESKKYMFYTIGTIVVMAALLSVLGFAIREGLVGVRAQFPHTAPVVSVSGEEDFATKADIEEVLSKRKQQDNSGSVSSGTTTKPIDTGSGN